ncbi:MAG: Na/Pi cotransporter family protein [Bacteroidetes bacterium]|nr:Na/Pi cotransporter family protein [Bacteroidota bacterium]MBT3423609.1 Na/Pi cotransporter family protein [Bacteroidota bacterium]MBT4968314.1 Na/Pi cotransporter family protein [Bacteroidota bacterium]MBT7996242.1 Na/Pi cotransporter family protein [Bacteroidota bacterium]
MNRRFYIILLLFILLINQQLIAANTDTDQVQWFFVIVGLLGGLALFLYGMDKMSEGLKKSAGNRMRSILAKLTNNRFVALAVGAFVTMVIQSSSATTVMLVSFVQAGLLNFTQSLGVIIGANIGTTFTAQLIAFKLTNYALLMVVLGFVFSAFVKNENLRNIGNAVLGFGILFFGMKIMSDAMYPLRSYPAFIHTLEGLENPIIGIAIGAIITALIQSSSAFTGIVIVLAQQNLITLEAGIPLILGANIGTSITAWMATIGAKRDTKRVAIAHSFFNIGGALLFVFWIPYFTDLVVNMSNVFGSGIARQIANAHTIFNIGVGLVFIPFTGILSRLILLMLPFKEEAAIEKHATKHLDQKMLSTPYIAISLGKAEAVRMLDNLAEMVKDIIKPFVSKKDHKKDKTFVEDIVFRDSKIDYLQEKIVKYLFDLGKEGLNLAQSKESYGLISIAHDIKAMSDIIVSHMLPLVELKYKSTTTFSKEGEEELRTFHLKMCKQISRVKKALEEFDPKKAHHIITKETKYQSLESAYRSQHLGRVYGAYEESVKTHQLHMEIMNLLIQINVYCGKIADTIYNTSPKTKEEKAIENQKSIDLVNQMKSKDEEL